LAGSSHEVAHHFQSTIPFYLYTCKKIATAQKTQITINVFKNTSKSVKTAKKTEYTPHFWKFEGNFNELQKLLLFDKSKINHDPTMLIPNTMKQITIYSTLCTL
jgi:hypothetical protein